MPAPDERLDAPHFHRNHAPIWDVLSRRLAGRSGDVLELGSGTGQHAVEFARRAPAINWWPSDVGDDELRSIAAWRAWAQLPNLRGPARIDLSERGRDWSALGLPTEFLAMVCANVIHIAPWDVAVGLFALAGERLTRDGFLMLYGPFMRDGRHTAPSNAAFDRNLRQSDPRWGVRDIADLRRSAAEVRLSLADEVEMPANNMILVFERIP